ncbi:hypothetical protein BX600DRAFT_438212 [Xylariales sp. PMI_506]|nr:hypothetical protein BX600DRAFT_438212 [Xylariales sp. PMI_506]
MPILQEIVDAAAHYRLTSAHLHPGSGYSDTPATRFTSRAQPSHTKRDRYKSAARLYRALLDGAQLTLHLYATRLEDVGICYAALACSAQRRRRSGGYASRYQPRYRGVVDHKTDLKVLGRPGDLNGIVAEPLHTPSLGSITSRKSLGSTLTEQEF